MGLILTSLKNWIYPPVEYLTDDDIKKLMTDWNKKYYSSDNIVGYVDSIIDTDENYNFSEIR